MKKLFAVLLLCLLVSCSAWAGGIETVTLFDRQSKPNTSLLIGADAEQIARYCPDGKLSGFIFSKPGRNAHTITKEKPR